MPLRRRRRRFAWLAQRIVRHRPDRMRRVLLLILAPRAAFVLFLARQDVMLLGRLFRHGRVTSSIRSRLSHAPPPQARKLGMAPDRARLTAGRAANRSSPASRAAATRRKARPR